jgi:hypothetical protein
MPELVPVDDNPFSTAVSGTDPILRCVEYRRELERNGEGGGTILSLRGLP